MVTQQVGSFAWVLRELQAHDRLLGSLLCLLLWWDKDITLFLGSMCVPILHGLRGFV